MKTSDLILTIVAGSFTVLMVTGMVQNRYFEKPNHGSHDINLQAHSVDLPAFHYVVINNQSNVEIKPAGSSQLVVRYAQDEKVPEVSYHVSNDTLYVGNSMDSIQNHTYTQLMIPAMSTGWIKGVNSSVRLYGFYAGKLNLELDKSRAELNSNQGENLTELTIHGTNDSNFDVNSFKVDSLKVQLDESNAVLSVRAANLSGSIKNHSRLSIKDVDHFDFSRDETSRLEHWN